MSSSQTLPRWLDGIAPGEVPLCAPPADEVVEAPLLLGPANAERRPPWIGMAGILFLLLVALLTAAARGVAPAPGLTVPLPSASAAPDATAEPSLLTPEEAAAVRSSMEAELASESYEGPRPAGVALVAASPADQQRALLCMTQAIYYEAGTESEAGMRAVAQVVINRIRHPDYPDTVCSVVYQGALRPGGGCQFTFTCDGALARRPVPSLWARAERHAREALAGRAFGEVGYATHYHTFEVWPNWGRRLTMTNMIGRHLFHRLPGNGGAPSAFTVRYAGHEPAVRAWQPRASDTSLPETAMAIAAGDRLPPAPEIRAPESAADAENLPQSRLRDSLPNSEVRPEYRDSGRWIGG